MKADCFWLNFDHKKEEEANEAQIISSCCMFSIKHQNESMARQDKKQPFFPFDEEVPEVPFKDSFWRLGLSL